MQEDEAIKIGLRRGETLQQLSAAVFVQLLGDAPYRYRIDLRFGFGFLKPREHRLPSSFEQGVVAELEWGRLGLRQSDPRALNIYATKFSATPRGRSARQLVDAQHKAFLQQRPSDDAELFVWRVEYLGKFLDAVPFDQLAAELSGMADQALRRAQIAERARDWDEAQHLVETAMRWETRLGELVPATLASLKKLHETIERRVAAAQLSRESRKPRPVSRGAQALKSWLCESDEKTVTTCAKDWGSAWVHGGTALCKNTSDKEACGKSVFCAASGKTCE